jgi:hypothetical protein
MYFLLHYLLNYCDNLCLVLQIKCINITNNQNLVKNVKYSDKIRKVAREKMTYNLVCCSLQHSPTQTSIAFFSSYMGRKMFIPFKVAYLIQYNIKTTNEKKEICSCIKILD